MNVFDFSIFMTIIFCNDVIASFSNLFFFIKIIKILNNIFFNALSTSINDLLY